ncbi:hypothetical protein IMSAGC018_01160 [Lachnospiraceae bacterium]|nr:hypothetical protein IMSAGC018_01160 [Lachnospiraceae bacterium]
MCNPRVCIIGVYFGTFPDYFDLWLRSAAANHTVDFMIFTDAKARELPDNVRFLPISFDEIIKRGQGKIDLQILLNRPYKCCDLRPAYGLLFSDYLEGYDYWGHCDFDLIWGDIRYFLDKYHLEKYDRFLPLGHLCLYKNTEENNRRFMLSGSNCGNYDYVFTTEQNCAFDELNGVGQIFLKNGFPVFHERIFADIAKIYKRYRLALEDINYDEQVFFWREGKVYRAYRDGGEIKEDEFIYIHFKERGKLPFEQECLKAPLFYVTNTGFYAGQMPVGLADMERYNHFPGTDYEKSELKAFQKAERNRNWMHRISKAVGMKEKIR